MYTAFALIIFFTGLSVFGWVFYSLVFKEKRLFVLLPFSIATGISFYLILVNTLSYFIPIAISFYLVWCILVFSSLFLSFFFGKKLKSIKFGISKKYFVYLMIIASVIAALAAVGDARNYGGGADLGISRIPLPGLIAGGNFPVKSIVAPLKLMPTHYATGLLAASTYKITSLPVWSGYIVQVGLFSWLIILLAFGLCYKITKNEFISLLGSLTFFFGNGLRYLAIFFKAPLVFYQVLTNQKIYAPFAFVGAALKNHINHPPVTLVLSFWGGLALSLILLITCLYFIAAKGKNWIIASLLCGVFLGFLALSAEAYFVVLSGAIFLYPFLIFSLNKKGILKEKLSSSELKRIFLISFIILTLGAPIALLQGGVITAFIHEGIFLKMFSANISSVALINPALSSVSGVIKTIGIEAGLVILLFIPTLFYLGKKKIVHFLALIIAISTLPPFLLTFKQSSNMDRFFFLTISLMHLAAGVFLGFLILKTNKFGKVVLRSIFCLMIGGGIISQLFHILYPPPWKSEKFFTKPPSASLIDYDAKNWILKNTTINDQFMAIQDLNLFPKYRFKRGPNDPRPMFVESLFFPAYYNRFTPIIKKAALHPYKVPPLRAKNIQEMRTECDHQALKNLNIAYIYATPQWPPGLEEKCLKNNKLKLVFESNKNKIYKVEYNR
jgi:hypothetical protein